MLMPTRHGIKLDWACAGATPRITNSNCHPSLVRERAKVLPLPVVRNHRHMGSYREAIDAYLAAQDLFPTVTTTPPAKAASNTLAFQRRARS